MPSVDWVLVKQSVEIKNAEVDSVVDHSNRRVAFTGFGFAPMASAVAAA